MPRRHIYLMLKYQHTLSKDFNLADVLINLIARLMIVSRGQFNLWVVPSLVHTQVLESPWHRHRCLSVESKIGNTVKISDKINCQFEMFPNLS